MRRGSERLARRISAQKASANQRWLRCAPQRDGHPFEEGRSARLLVYSFTFGQCFRIRNVCEEKEDS